jgi:hypothetical protein
MMFGSEGSRGRERGDFGEALLNQISMTAAVLE